MGRTNNRRAETAPFTVRLSPAERAALEAKAARFGLKTSEFARAALAGYVPNADAAATRERNTSVASGLTPQEPSELRVEYDDPREG